MATEELQRTLILGLGKTGSLIADRLLEELATCLGDTGVIQGLALPTEEIKLSKTGTALLISPAAEFSTWQLEFEEKAAATLQSISRLDHLTRLRQQEIRLGYVDEIHVIVVVNLAEQQPDGHLPQLVASVRHITYRTLGCEASFSGLLLYSPVAPEQVESAITATGPVEVARFAAKHFSQLFDRGCFLAGLTNEIGLIVGDPAQLIEQTVAFLSLLVRETQLASIDWNDNGAAVAGWGMQLASFGLARLVWPGPALVGSLSQWWMRALLEELTTLPPTQHPTPDLIQQARQTAQQWFTAEKLAPPLQIESLSVVMPALPNSLAAIVPDPPMPWLLQDTKQNVERAARLWQENWLAQRRQLENTLTELEMTWASQAQAWLEQQLAHKTTGTILLANSNMAAVSELLTTFIEGVEQRLSEAEADLNRFDQRLGQAVTEIIELTASLPASLLSMLLRWGLRPTRWVWAWQQCRQAQTLLRNYAHLSRGMLAAWELVSYYEMLLPFYRQLWVHWQPVITRWQGGCQQVATAMTTLQSVEQQQQPELGLTDPWQPEMVLTLYKQIVMQHTNDVWAQAGTLVDWVNADADTGVILERLRRQTRKFLEAGFNISVDQALQRQMPLPAEQSGWLAGLSEQARPFWRYDETTLAEQARAQVRLDTWLFLPGGDRSPLAKEVQTWPQPPLVLPGCNPLELTVVTVRRVQLLPSE